MSGMSGRWNGVSIMLVILLAGVLLFLSGCTSGTGNIPANNSAVSQNNQSGLANPASVKCIQDGGNLTILRDDMGEYGVCTFSNGAKCEEWAYFRGECSPNKPNYCAEDKDCACGVHISTGECFVGSKGFVNVDKQCPDYCTGIAGNFETQCVSHQCKLVKKNNTEDTGFCGTSTNGPCSDDSGCIIGGCSGQVCQSKSEPPVVTTCEYKSCYDKIGYGVSCRCVDNECRWVMKQGPGE